MSLGYFGYQQQQAQSADCMRDSRQTLKCCVLPPGPSFAKPPPSIESTYSVQAVIASVKLVGQYAIANPGKRGRVERVKFKCTLDRQRA
jgi:hypothetical protein